MIDKLREQHYKANFKQFMDVYDYIYENDLENLFKDLVDKGEMINYVNRSFKHTKDENNKYGTIELIQQNKNCPGEILSCTKCRKEDSIEEKVEFCIYEEIQPNKREFDIMTNKNYSISEEPFSESNEDIEKMMEVQKKITYEKMINTFFGLIKKKSFDNKIIFESVIERRNKSPYKLTG